jgi:hypothetical protein
MGELINVAPTEIRLMSIEGRKIRVLLKNDRVIEHLYSSVEALDRDLRDWAARSGYALPNLLQSARGENDIAGFGP